MTARLAHIRFTHAGPRFPSVRHLVEMMVAMWIGMPLRRALFAAICGSASNEAVRQHDVAWTLLMAVAMTVPMVAVMLYRGHSRRGAGEMAAAMIAGTAVRRLEGQRRDQQARCRPLRQELR